MYFFFSNYSIPVQPCIWFSGLPCYFSLIPCAFLTGIFVLHISSMPLVYSCSSDLHQQKQRGHMLVFLSFQLWFTAGHCTTIACLDTTITLAQRSCCQTVDVCSLGVFITQTLPWLTVTSLESPWVWGADSLWIVCWRPFDVDKRVKESWFSPLYLKPCQSEGWHSLLLDILKVGYLVSLLFIKLVYTS